jgi:hypothetical protein
VNGAAVKFDAGPVEVVPIQSFEVPTVWLEIEELIAEICRLNLNRFAPHDFYRLLLTKECQLWVARRVNKIIAIGITAIRAFPHGKAAQVLGITGKEIDSWIKFEPMLLDWARGEGCSAIDGIARAGWKRKVKGWNEVGVVLTRSLAN